MRRGILTRYLANQSGFICATSKGGKEEEKENKSAGKPFEKSEEEKRCGNACSKSRLIVSHDEIFTRDYNSPTLRDARSILGAPNDTYEHLSDIKDHGKVSGVKWPPNIRVCNGRRVSKVISKNAEENSYDAMDKMPKVFSLKSFKNIPNKASAILRVKKKSASSNLRGKKLIAVKGCFTKRKKVAKCHKKKITYGKKKDTDNEVGISRYSDDVTVAGKGNNNEQIEKFDKFFCEPSGSQDLTKCSSKCRNIMKTKSNDRSFSEIGMKTEPSTKTFKTAKNNSSQSEKEEWEDLSQRNKKILEKFKPKTTLDSVRPLNQNKVRNFYSQIFSVS